MKLLRVAHTHRLSIRPWSRSAGIVACLVGAIALTCPVRSQVNVTTQHNDTMRTGQNLQETLLTPARVNMNSFGKLWSRVVDGQVYAQPLYVSSVNITNNGPHNGSHNLLIVATQHDSVYAFDADDNQGNNANPLWHASLGTSVPVPNTYFGNRYGAFHDIEAEIGITSTPVIDLPSKTLYTVTFSQDAVGGPYHQKLHALDITTGLEKNGSPVEITASVPGTGYDNMFGQVAFNPMQAGQRPGLLLTNGKLFIAFASHADTDPYHGWLLGYDATTLNQVSAFCDSPNGNEGGVWMAGSGPAADAAGNIYLITGNGSFSGDVNGGDYGDSFLRFNAANASVLQDWFTPYDQQSMADRDADLGSGGTMLLPDNINGLTHPHLLVGAGKDGKIYVVDRDSMGGFHANSDTNIVQSLPNAIGGSFGSPALFNSTIYYGGGGDYLRAFAFRNGSLVQTDQSTPAFGWPGMTPSISANGATNGIVWGIENAGNAVLHAFEAGRLSNELYNSSRANIHDTAGPAVKFTVPTIANGKVFVGAQYEVDTYGMLHGRDTKLVANAYTARKNGDGTYAVDVVVTNVGNYQADEVQITSAKLATTQAPAAPALPLAYGSLSPRQSKKLTLNFPAAAASQGKHVRLTVLGTWYTSGANLGPFLGTAALTLP